MRFDPNNPPETVEFYGVTYRRMGGQRKYYLSQAKRNADRKNPKGLHVAIWEKHANQGVPPGYEVNHIDRDTFNFSFDNLECLPKSVHRSLPKTTTKAVLDNLERIRPMATEWHRSEEGRSWHRKNAIESLAKARASR